MNLVIYLLQSIVGFLCLLLSLNPDIQKFVLKHSTRIWFMPNILGIDYIYDFFFFLWNLVCFWELLGSVLNYGNLA